MRDALTLRHDRDLFYLYYVSVGWPLTVQNGHCIIILCLQDCSTNHFIILMKYNKHKQSAEVTGVWILLILKSFSSA